MQSNITGDSREAVALALLQHIVENDDTAEPSNTDWLLTNYVQCFRATGGLQPK